MTDQEEMIQNIEKCRGGTWYTEEQISNMKANSIVILALLKSIEGTTYVYKDLDREGKPRERNVLIEFERFRFGHNDMLLYVGPDALLRWSLKEIFDEWKMNKRIPGYGGNGWGTAFLFSYDPWGNVCAVTSTDAGINI